MSFYNLIYVDTIAERDALPQQEGMFVYVRETETCYQLVMGVWNVYFTGGAVPPEFGVPPGSSPISQTFTNLTPTPETVGGIDAGSTFDNVPLPDMWARLLYPFQDPAFTAFSVTGLGTSEVGQSIPSYSAAFSWTVTNAGNINASGLTIRNQTANTVLQSNIAPNASPLSIVLATINGPSTPSTQTFRIQGTSQASITFQRDYSFSWYWAVFHGESSSTSLTGVDIQNLRIKRLLANSNTSYAMNGGGYKYICYPTSMGLKTTFKDPSTNLDVSMQPPVTVSTTNSYGVTTNYYVHRTTNQLGGAITIAVS